MPEDPMIGPPANPALNAALTPMNPPSAPAAAPSPQAPPDVPQQLPATAPTATAVPPAPGQTFHNLSHALLGGILGSLAGPQPASGYTVDPTGTTQANAQGSDTTGAKLRRIAQSALIGLAAGSQVQGDPLGSLGAGAMAREQHDQAQDKDKRKQASDEFKQQQDTILNKANVAHILIGTVGLRQNLLDADLATNQKQATDGAEQVDAAILSPGNRVVGQRDMSESDMKQFRLDHPEYHNYTPLITSAEPATKEDGTADTDDSGVQKVNRKYTFVDLKDPVALTQGTIDKLKLAGVDGVENLKVGQEIDPKTFNSVYATALNAYNKASRDPKNVDVIDVTDSNGNVVKAAYNKATQSTSILKDEDGKPLSGKARTEMRDIFDPSSQKTYTYLVNADTGRKIKAIGESPRDINSLGNGIGDFSKTGTDFLATIPPEIQPLILKMDDYGIQPADLGRSQNRSQLVAATAQYDPTWDEKEYKERFNFLNQWNGAAGDGATRTRINTAIGHLGLLDQAGNALANNDVRFFNNVANEFGYQTGTPAKVAYDIIAQKAAGEAAGAVKGGAGAATDPEIAAQYKSFNSDASPKQRKTAVVSNLHLLNTQAESLDSRFSQTMKKSSYGAGKPVIFPQNQEIMSKFGLGPKTTPQNGPTPAGAQGEVHDAGGKLIGHTVPNAQGQVVFVPLGQ